MNQCITASRGGGGSTGHFTGSTTGPHFDLRNKDNLLLYQKAILILFFFFGQKVASLFEQNQRFLSVHSERPRCCKFNSHGQPHAKQLGESDF